MARMDSLIMVMLGLAQLLIADSFGLNILTWIFNGTGFGTIGLGIYFLLFIGRHQQEFSDAYSKLEKTNLMRDESGELQFIDANPRVTKVIWYFVPIALTFIGAIAFLTNLGS
jgi:hypothetical protein